MGRANAAYYAQHDPYRDFTTAPEISQVFGELLGAWAAVTWEAMGRPKPVHLAELGPGRGTLISDALRTVARVAPALREALDLHLVEGSRSLRRVQAERVQAEWHGKVEELPREPCIVLANEFLDALPVRQRVRRGPGWVERWVEEGMFVERDFTPGGMEAAEGAVLEFSEEAHRVVREITARVVEHGGAALFLDYGAAESRLGDTLQAIRDGAWANPLERPGHADLTAHVDFAGLAETVRRAGGCVHGPIPQGIFLARLGLFQRTDQLARTQPPARAAALIRAAQRLAEPDAMGRLFKAMAITHPELSAPAGFSP